MITPMRLACVLVALFGAACLQSHGKGTEVTTEECATCHLQNDFDPNASPGHSQVAAGQPACGDCHRTSGPPGCMGPDCWKPALEGIHTPTTKFLLSTPHTGIKCLGCHNLDLGANCKDALNVDCIQCHPNDNVQADSHDGAKSSSGMAYVYQAQTVNFCFSCHPSGQIARHTAADRFRLSGPHDGYCVKCHDASLGPNTADGANTKCVQGGCHSLSETDGHDGHSLSGCPSSGPCYKTLRTTSLHFCLTCHPSGRGD